MILLRITESTSTGKFNSAKSLCFQRKQAHSIFTEKTKKSPVAGLFRFHPSYMWIAISCEASMDS